MIQEFDTTDASEAAAALIVYKIYRSKSSRFKINMEMWGRIERFVKASAKRSKSIPEFIDFFKRRMECDQIQPDELVQVVNEADDKQIIGLLYNQAAWIILLVRERLNREKEEKGDKDAE